MTQRADSPVFLDPDEHSSELAQIPPRGLSRRQKETLPALSLALSVTILPLLPCAQLLGASVVSLMLEKHFGSPAERYQERQGVIILFFPHLQCAERPSEAAPTFSMENKRLQ